MEFVKELEKPDTGGKCTNCKESFDARFMRRFLMKQEIEKDSEDDILVLREPFIYCNSCALTVK